MMVTGGNEHQRQPDEFDKKIVNVSLEKIDWHDKEFIRMERERKG